MARKCSVVGCRNTQWEKKKNQMNISFHQLPTDPVSRKAWINRIRLLNNQNFPQNGIICSNHFEPRDLVENKCRTKLIDGAVPVNFPLLKDFVNIESVIDADDDVEMNPVQQSETDSCKKCTKGSFNKENEIQADTNIVAPKKNEPSPITNGFENIKSSVKRPFEVLAKPDMNTAADLQYRDPVTPKRSKTIRYPGDIDENQEMTPKSTRKCILMCKTKIKAQSKIVYKLKQKVKRQQKRILGLKALTRELKKKFGLSHHAKESIDNTFQDDIIYQLRAGRKTKSYNENVKSFALTLNFYSNAAYCYVRRTFGNHLPAPKTLYNWYKNINGDPGIPTEGLCILKSKVDAFKKDNKTFYVALMADEMAVRSQLIWNDTKKKYIGYVDYGLKNEDSDSTEEATQALVFMVVPVNSRGKLPIGYYLTNKFSGEEQANIVEQILTVVHETGAEVISFTFDGATNNITMSKTLGADIDNKATLGSSFNHPCTERPIHIFLDICHMLKLVRNNWASKGIFYDNEGNKIKWDYILELEKIQKQQGLSLATKITKQHTQFQNNKMKVKLAAQVLSNSVADALEYCKNRYPQFEGCEATIKFVRMFNNLFDILNSRSFLGKGYQQPFQQSNEKRNVELFESAETYIKQLYLMVPTKKKDVITLKKQNIVLSGIKRGFVGFLLGIKSFSDIYERFVKTGKLKFILAFKFSQDHLETLFSVIRAKGGFNNNPNCMQFKAAFKRILMRNQLSSTLNANCAFDDAQILHFSSLIERTTTFSPTVTLFQNDDQPIGEDEFDELNTIRLTDYVSDVVSYISGFVERSLKAKMKCEHCLNGISSSKIDLSALIKVKNRGGLTIPQVDVFKVCKIAENKLWSFDIAKKDFYPKLFNLIMRDLVAEKLFDDMSGHSSKFVESEHRLLLIKNIVTFYLKIRLHHIAKQHDINKKNTFLRSKLTKLIHFSNQ